MPPMNRFQLRNEYSLGDPELYKVADKDDPEALLESVAMAGLVGVLRQLGDLAEFAAEIFHDLHEEVVATAARGHGLTARVQQLEAEFPTIEKRLLSQTNHTTPLYNSGIDWHPNSRMDANLITGVDLPRFVMDSYEECRGPPRLFLLDKFDVAGAGACLTRYTDPSFFKVEVDPSAIAKSNGLREKRLRKEKKKGSIWRNGETRESFTASHAKLHQLLLVDRLQNRANDPERRVKLKKRQLAGSLCDEKARKAYMEKFVKTCSSGHKFVPEVSFKPSSMNLTANSTAESGLGIVEIGTVSPARESKNTEERMTRSLPDIKEVVHSSVNESSEIMDEDSEVLSLPNRRSDSEEDSFTFSVRRNVKEVTVNSGTESTLSEGEYSSDGIPSEVESYVDALATIDSEIETDSEYRAGKFLKDVAKTVKESDASREYNGPKFSLDSRYGGSSTRSDSPSCSFQGRNNIPCSETISDVAEATTDGRAAAVISSTQVLVADLVQMPLNQLSASEDVQQQILEFGEPEGTSLAPNTPGHPSDMVSSVRENALAKLQIDENSLDSDRLLIDASKRLNANGSCEGTLSDALSHVSDGVGVSARSPLEEEQMYDNAYIPCEALSDASADNTVRSLGDVLHIEASGDGSLLHLGNRSFSSFHSVSSTEDEWTHGSGQPSNTSIVATDSYLGIPNTANLSSDDNDIPANEDNSEFPVHLDPAYSPRLLVRHLAEIADAGPSPHIDLLEEAFRAYPDNMSHTETPEAAEVGETKPEFITPSDVNKSSSLIHSLSEILYPAAVAPEEDDLNPAMEQNSDNELHTLSSVQNKLHLSGKTDPALSAGHDLREEDALVYGDEQADSRSAIVFEEIESGSPEHEDVYQSVDTCSDVVSTLDNSPIGVVNRVTQECQCSPSTDENTERLALRLDPAQNQSSNELLQDLLETDACLSGPLELPQEGAQVGMDSLSYNGTAIAADNEDIMTSELNAGLRETSTPMSVLLQHHQTSELAMGKQEAGNVQIYSSEDGISHSTDVSFIGKPRVTNTDEVMGRYNEFFMSSKDASQTENILEQMPSETAVVALSLEHFVLVPGQVEAEAAAAQSEANCPCWDNNVDSVEKKLVVPDALPDHSPSTNLDSSKSMSPCKDSAFLHHGVPDSAHIHAVDSDTDADDLCHENLHSMSSSVGIIPFYSKRLREQSPPAEEDSPWNHLEVVNSDRDEGIDVLEDVIQETDVSNEVAESAHVHAVDSDTDADNVHRENLHSMSFGVGVIPFYSRRPREQSPPAMEDSLWNNLEVANSDCDGEFDVLEDVNQVTEASANKELNPYVGASADLSNMEPPTEALNSSAENNWTQNEIWVAERDLFSKECIKQLELTSSNDAQLPDETAYNATEIKPDLETEIERPDVDTELEVLHVIEVTSNSVTCAEQIQPPLHSEKNLSADVASGSSDEEVVTSSASVSPQVGRLVEGQANQNLDDRTRPMDPLSCGFPVLPVLPNVPEITMEEMPPLPPLPPMQWRLGKLRPSPVRFERPVQLDVHTEMLTQASKLENTEHVDSLLLSYSLGDSKTQDMSDFSGGIGETRTSTDSLQPMDSEDHQHDIPAMETDTHHPSLYPLEDEQPVGSLRREDFSSSAEGAEIKQGQTFIGERLQHISSITEKESNIPSFAVGPLPTLQGEQQLPLGLMAPSEVTAWLANASRVIPASQERNTNGIMKKKLPRPRNPLIDAVVAVDKSKLRKVGERVNSLIEQNVEGSIVRLEVPQLRKVGERVKSSVDQNFEESNARLDVPQLRKVGERVECPLKQNVEESNARPDVPRLRKVGERTKIPVEQNVGAGDALLGVPQLRKVAERAKSPVPQEEERDVLLEQIRNKSFYLKPAATTRPSIQGPKTNLKVAAILEKANNIRQAMAGSDGDDSDGWSDS